MELLKFILATVGLVMILNISKLFKPIREMISRWHQNSPNKLNWFLSSIFDCSLCMGFWAGMIVYIVMYKWMQTYTVLLYLLDYLKQIGWQTIGYGCIGAFVSLILVTLYQKIERSR